MTRKLSRRNFINSATLSATAILLHSGFKSDPDYSQEKNTFVLRNNPLKLGLMTYMIGASWDIETIIQNLHSTKLKHVELRTTHKHGVEVSLSKQERKEVRNRFSEANIAISLASAFSYHTTDQVELRKNIEGAKEYLQLAADVGAEGVRVFPNAAPEEGDKDREKILEQIGKSVAECAIVGNNLGVQVRLEEHGRGTANIPVIKKILDYADNPHIYIIWNSTQSSFTGKGLPCGYEGMGLEEQFNMVKDRIGCVHLRDLSTNYPWRQLFMLLNRSGYKGYCDIEVAPASCEPHRYLNNFRALFHALQDAL